VTLSVTLDPTTSKNVTECSDDIGKAFPHSSVSLLTSAVPGQDHGLSNIGEDSLEEKVVADILKADHGARLVLFGSYSILMFTAMLLSIPKRGRGRPRGSKSRATIPSVPWTRTLRHHRQDNYSTSNPYHKGDGNEGSEYSVDEVTVVSPSKPKSKKCRRLKAK
jgi:hypothetical protein